MTKHFMESIIDDQEIKIRLGKMSLEEAAREFVSLALSSEEELPQIALNQPYQMWKSVVLFYWLILKRPDAYSPEVTRVLLIPNCQLHFAILHYATLAKDKTLLLRLTMMVDEAIRTESMNALYGGEGVSHEG